MISRLEKKLRKLVRSYRQSKRKLPERQNLVNELREAFAALPPLQTKGSFGPEDAWQENVLRLRHHVRDDNPMEFLSWDVIKGTMFVRDSDYIADELDFLQRQVDWRSRWQPAVRETAVGWPQLSWRYPDSSGNLLHNAYHLARFEQETKGTVTDVAAVVEFGGGYGSMCRLFQNLNFQGRYLIFDLPEFSLLQRFFLQALEFEVLTPEAFCHAQRGIVCISDFNELTRLIENYLEPRSSMFLATWSLSEAPLELRSKVIPLVRGFRKMLIGYQESFEGVDNRSFFEDFLASLDGTASISRQIEHLPGNHYIFRNLAV